MGLQEVLRTQIALVFRRVHWTRRRNTRYATAMRHFAGKARRRVNEDMWPKRFHPFIQKLPVTTFFDVLWRSLDKYLLVWQLRWSGNFAEVAISASEAEKAS